MSVVGHQQLIIPDMLPAFLDPFGGDPYNKAKSGKPTDPDPYSLQNTVHNPNPNPNEVITANPFHLGTVRNPGNLITSTAGCGRQTQQGKRRVETDFVSSIYDIVTAEKRDNDHIARVLNQRLVPRIPGSQDWELKRTAINITRKKRIKNPNTIMEPVHYTGSTTSNEGELATSNIDSTGLNAGNPNIIGRAVMKEKNTIGGVAVAPSGDMPLSKTSTIESVQIAENSSQNAIKMDEAITIEMAGARKGIIETAEVITKTPSPPKIMVTGTPPKPTTVTQREEEKMNITKSEEGKMNITKSEEGKKIEKRLISLATRDDPLQKEYANGVIIDLQTYERSRYNFLSRFKADEVLMRKIKILREKRHQFDWMVHDWWCDFKQRPEEYNAEFVKKKYADKLRELKLSNILNSVTNVTDTNRVTTNNVNNHYDHNAVNNVSLINNNVRSKKLLGLSSAGKKLQKKQQNNMKSKEIKNETTTSGSLIESTTKKKWKRKDKWTYNWKAHELKKQKKVKEAKNFLKKIKDTTKESLKDGNENVSNASDNNSSSNGSNVSEEHDKFMRTFKAEMYLDNEDSRRRDGMFRRRYVVGGRRVVGIGGSPPVGGREGAVNNTMLLTSSVALPNAAILNNSLNDTNFQKKDTRAWMTSVFPEAKRRTDLLMIEKKAFKRHIFTRKKDKL